jgi:hypothetical protein
MSGPNYRIRINRLTIDAPPLSGAAEDRAAERAVEREVGRRLRASGLGESHDPSFTHGIAAAVAGAVTRRLAGGGR